MKGETVTITGRTQTGFTPAGEPDWQTITETVGDVLIQDGAQANAAESTRSDGVSVAKTCHFPRAWAYHSLRGWKVVIDGIAYPVIGDPRPYTGGLTPTRWNLTVELRDERG